MKKSLAFITLITMLVGTVGCGGATASTIQPDNTQTNTVDNTATTDDSITDGADETTEVTTANEDGATEGNEGGDKGKAQLLYEFDVKVYFSEEPEFTNPDSALAVNLGFEYSEGEYATAEDEEATMYFDEYFNLLATVIYEEDGCHIQVYDSEVSFNISAETGYDNECLNLLCAEIEMDGDTKSYVYEDCCYRSYTGVWFFGIAKVSNGVIGEYDASWTEVDF